MTEEIKNEELNENKNEVVAEEKEENKSNETPITQTFNFKLFNNYYQEKIW